MMPVRLRPSPIALMARGAGVLLLVLLSHLAVMASPAHVAAIHNGGAAAVHDAAREAGGHCGVCISDPLSVGGIDQSGDCGIEAAPPDGLGLRFTAGSLPAASPWPWLAQVGSLWPRPEVTQPPGRANVQAVLQVFRT
jgi:hypothetical protein